MKLFFTEALAFFGGGRSGKGVVESCCLFGGKFTARLLGKTKPKFEMIKHVYRINPAIRKLGLL